MAVFKSNYGTWGYNIYVKEKPRIRKQGFKTKAEATLEMSKVLNDVSSGKYFIEDRNTLAPSDAASYQLLREQVDDVLFTLSEREARVLQLRFGLEDGRSRTLEEVGRDFGVTRERIRQIEAKALRKLRHPTRSKKLRDFLE